MALPQLKYNKNELRQNSVIQLKKLCDKHSIDYTSFRNKRYKQEYIDALLAVHANDDNNDNDDQIVAINWFKCN